MSQFGRLIPCNFTKINKIYIRMYIPALENSFLLQSRARHGRASGPGASKTRARVQAETTPQRPRRSKIRESRLGSLSKTGTRARKREAQTSPNFYFFDFISTIHGCSSIRQGVALRGQSFSRQHSIKYLKFSDHLMPFSGSSLSLGMGCRTM